MCPVLRINIFACNKETRKGCYISLAKKSENAFARFHSLILKNNDISNF